MSSSRPASPSSSGEPPAKRARTRSPQADKNYDGEAELVRIKKRLIKVKQLRERGTSFGVDEEQGEDAGESKSNDVLQRSTSVLERTRSSSPEFRILGSSSRTEASIGVAVNEVPVEVPVEVQLTTVTPTTVPSGRVPTPPPSLSSGRPPSPPLHRSILPTAVPRSSLAPLRSQHPSLAPCRSVYSYTRLNHIEEGTYGIVFRARCNETGGIYALKKLKLEEEKQGFPITSLREVMALMVAGGHENVVGVREIVVGDTLNQIFIVMPFIEHDLKTLLETMPHPFLQSEVKTLMMQLLSAVAHCHSNWILHRDLKTSNLLLTNRGQIKVADFGLARKFGDPLGEMTQLVVTLWYRSPELLLGAKEYTTAVDVWSVGCIFAELMQKEALFPGRGEIDQIGRIFKLLGKPTEEMWPGFSRLPLTRTINPIGPPYSSLRKKYQFLSDAGYDLLASLLRYDPEERISAEVASRHPYFDESPYPKHPDLFSSFPSVAAGEKRQKIKSPSAPVRAIEKPEFDLV